MVTLDFGCPELVPCASTLLTTSSPSNTFPKTTWRPSNQAVFTVVMKNWEPLLIVSGKWPSGGMLPLPIHYLLGVWSSVCHREIHRTFVLQNEVLILEFVTVNRFASPSVAMREVSTLNHEIRDFRSVQLQSTWKDRGSPFTY